MLKDSIQVVLIQLQCDILYDVFMVIVMYHFYDIFMVIVM